MCRTKTFILFIFLGSLASLQAALSPDLECSFAQGITVDLREPEFSEGVLTTEKGGVITGPDMRIQASKITYTRKAIEGTPVFTIEAEGEMLLEFGPYIFAGDRLVYDFQTRTGTIYKGRTAIEPWFFGGSTIQLCADGTTVIEEGFVTTSENVNNDWEISVAKAILTEDRLVRARDVRFYLGTVPVLWLPAFKANLDSIFDSPIRYYARWGGKQGHRFGLTYEIFSWRRLKTLLRLDCNIKRGLGIGFETYATSPDHRENFEMINYIAQDSSIVHPDERIRYRFQGVYSNVLRNDTIGIDLTWDKLSDKDMPTDYNDRGLQLATAGRTELHVRQAADNAITNFFTRVRVNNFQTLKQELPTLQQCWRPIHIGSTGIISQTEAKAAYLDFKYTHHLPHVHDFNSTRLELAQSFYRPIHFSFLNITPKAGGVAIYYGNSPSGEPRWAALGTFGVNVNTRLNRIYGNCKHFIIPYANYNYFTYPTSAPFQHYIFDIDDGWYRLNTLRFGVNQNFYRKPAEGYISRFLSADLYANAFFATKTLPVVIPRVYLDLSFSSSAFLRHSFQTAWDFQHGRIFHFNFRTDWTLSQDMAISAEFRHRDAYDWRKVDHDNFILDSYIPERLLFHSALSDRRDTLLLHFFYRIHPSWAVEFESRQGWNRRHEPGYSEYEVDILARLRSAWNVKLSYRHREHRNDRHRVALNISIGINPPDFPLAEELVPCVEF